jgi:hypothetical protein
MDIRSRQRTTIALRVLSHLCGLDQTVTDEEIASLRTWAYESETLDELACKIVRREIDRERSSGERFSKIA